MNPVDAWYAAFVQVEGDKLVGGQHEFFDQFVCQVMFADTDPLDVASGVHMDFRFRHMEIDTATLESLLPEELAELVHVGQGL